MATPTTPPLVRTNADRDPTPVPRQKPHTRAGDRERVAERRLQAFELRKAGASYRAIGRQLGVRESTAYKLVVARLRELAVLEEPLRADVLRIELERLDALTLAHYQRATNGDVHATKMVLNVMARRAALLGLDAPDRHEVTGRDGEPLLSLAAVDAILRGDTARPAR